MMSTDATPERGFSHIDENWLLDKLNVVLERGGGVRLTDKSMDIDRLEPATGATILLRAILMELRAIRRATGKLRDRSEIL